MAPDFEKDDPERLAKSLFDEFVGHVEMNELSEYLARGRSLSHLADAELKDVWLALVETMAKKSTTKAVRDLNDAAAELRFRGIEKPKIPAEMIRTMIAELKSLGPAALSGEMEAKLTEFLAARDKPEN